MTAQGDRQPAGPESVAQVGSSDSVTLALHDLGGAGTPLLLCHPTGFHGLVWGPVAAALDGAARTWAVDFRGHGDSSLPRSGSLAWQGFGDDVLAVVDHLERTGAIGVGQTRLVGAGHSMGGAALLMAEQARPGLFSALWCFEPIVVPGTRFRRDRNPMSVAARRRKAVFPDRQAALANYAAKPPLDALAPAALDAYVLHGFRDLPEGGVGLKCDPETEATVFEEGSAHDTYTRLGEVTCPVVVARSGDGGFPAQMAAAVAEALPDGRLVQFDDLTHFGPMEDPATVATAIKAVL